MAAEDSVAKPCVGVASEGVAKYPLKPLFHSAALRTRTPMYSLVNKINHLAVVAFA
jgi:hypothetical protein